MSRVGLQHITDVGMYNVVENSILDDISMISTRHAQANSPSFPDTYDTSLPKQNLIYLDANNLYGWAMSQFLRIRGFRFIQQDEIDVLKLQQLFDEAERMGIYSRGIFIAKLVYTIVMMTTRSSPSR